MTNDGQKALQKLLKQQAQLIDLAEAAVDQGMDEATWLCIAASMYALITSASAVLEVTPAEIRDMAFDTTDDEKELN